MHTQSSADSMTFYYSLAASPEGRPGMRGHYAKVGSLPPDVTRDFQSRTSFYLVRPFDGSGLVASVLRNVVVVDRKKLAPNNISSVVLHLGSVSAAPVLANSGNGGPSVRFYGRGNQYCRLDSVVQYLGDQLVRDAPMGYNVIVALSPSIRANAKTKSLEAELDSYLARITSPKRVNPKRSRKAQKV